MAAVLAGVAVLLLRGWAWPKQVSQSLTHV